MRFAVCGLALLGLFAAWPALHAQPAAKLARVGHLGHGLDSALMATFRQSLVELGYAEGRNIAFEYRYAEGRADALPALADELAALNVDVIVANGTPAARAAQRATSTVPIVIVGVGGDPVQLGLVRTLSRPGGNVTGIAARGTELWGKRLELFREALPQLTRVAILANPNNPGNVLAVKELEAVAPHAAVKLHTVMARNPGELARAFAEIPRESPDAMIVIWDAFLLSHGKRIADFAVKQRLPTLAPVKEYVHVGALMSYGANVPDQWRRAAHYVDRILKGARAADLPVEQPTKFDLAINLSTAKALGLKLPTTLVLRADDVVH